MKSIKYLAVAFGLGLLTTSCSDYLDVDAPANTDDNFVTSTTAETWKAFSRNYAYYTGSIAGGGNYNWNDPCSDADYYPDDSYHRDQAGPAVPYQDTLPQPAHPYGGDPGQHEEEGYSCAFNIVRLQLEQCGCNKVERPRKNAEQMCCHKQGQHYKQEVLHPLVVVPAVAEGCGGGQHLDYHTL